MINILEKYYGCDIIPLTPNYSLNDFKSIVEYAYSKEIESIFLCEKEMYLPNTGYILLNLTNGIYYGQFYANPASNLTLNYNIANKAIVLPSVTLYSLFFYNIYQTAMVGRVGTIKYYIINFKN